MPLSRRVCFTTLANNDHPQPADGTRTTEPSTDAVRETPESRPDRAADTVRLELTLFESDEVTYPEFTYSQLVKQQDQGRADDEVAAAVERLEKKYGSKPKNKDRIQDLIDIGYGYEEDSFIDNSEAYDEFVPASITTKLGGFYINSGLLQFRQASDTDDVATGEETPEATKKRKLSLGQCKPKKKKVCGEDGELEYSVDQRFWGLNETRPDDVKKKKKKRKKSSSALDVASMLRKFEREKAKRQRPPEQVAVATAADAAGGGASAVNDPLMSLIGSTNDHALIQAANTVDFDIDLESLLRVSEAAPAPKSLPQFAPEAPDWTQGTSSQVQPEPGPDPDPDPVQLLSKTVSTSRPPCVPPLEGIPAGLNDSIQKLNLAALTTDGESKVKFFSPETNSILLDIELQCRERGGQVRSRVYTHLSSYLPCSRETLLKRVKKILHSHTEQRPPVDDPVCRLREAIGKVMPEQIACFQESCLLFKQVKTSGVTVEEKPGASNLQVEPEDRSAPERSGNRGVPKKLFQWNQEVRECLSRVLREKTELFQGEEREVLDLKTFLDHEVKPLWPKGWMQSRVLMSESRKILNLVTPSRFKKTRFKKKPSSDCSSVAPAPEPLGVDLQDGEDGATKTEADGDGGIPTTTVAADGSSLASLQSEQPARMNFSTDSSLVLLANQALAEELPPPPPSVSQQLRHWSAAVDIRSVALLPPPGGFPLTDSCQVVLPELLEGAGFARHVDAGQAQVLRADANVTIQ